MFIFILLFGSYAFGGENTNKGYPPAGSVIIVL